MRQDPFYLGPERRSEERTRREVKFKCFYKGRKVQTVTWDINTKGAFLLLDRVVKPGEILILEPITRGYLGRPPHIVARVVHFRLAPHMGAGVKFELAVSPEGLDELVRFLSDTIGLTIPESEQNRFRAAADTEIAYNFSTGRLELGKRAIHQRHSKTVNLFGIRVKEDMLERLGLNEVKVVYTEAPRKKRVSIGEDISMATRADSSVDPIEAAQQIEEWMRIVKSKKEVNLDATLSFESVKLDVKLVAMDLRSVAIQSEKILPGVGKRVFLDFTINTPQRTHEISLLCEIRKVIHNKQTKTINAELKIITIRHEPHSGFLKKWIRSLR